MVRWVIYCSGKKQPTKNFQIGMKNSIWGNKNDIYEEFEVGDIVLFVHHLEGGHGRANLDKFSKGRTIRKLVKVEVTKKSYEERKDIWDDDKYPYRFDFKIIAEEKNIEISRNTHEIELLDGIRRASIAGNNLAKFNFPKGHIPFAGKFPDKIPGTKTEEHEITKKSKNKEGWVYIIRNYAWNDWVKVGRTNNLKGRISTYQTGDPYSRYNYWGWVKVKDAVHSELMIHHALQKKFNHEFHGEWYKRPTGDIQKIIEGILKKNMDKCE